MRPSSANGIRSAYTRETGLTAVQRGSMLVRPPVRPGPCGPGAVARPGAVDAAAAPGLREETWVDLRVRVRAA